jgi:tetratricopeptide repeat protein
MRKRIEPGQADAMVRSFRLQRFIRGLILLSVGAAALIGTVGYIVALVGPEDGPVRRFVESHGLLPGLEEARQNAQKNATLAREAFERGDVYDLERAEEYIGRARIYDKRNGRLAADQALIICEHADVLLRWQRDLERDADDAAANAGDVRHLRELASVKGARAQELIRSAAGALQDAERLAPSSLETLRAQAQYHRMTNDREAARRYLDQAKAQLAGGQDPWTLVLEASFEASEPEKASKEALEKSAALLTRALTNSPKFFAARVRLARTLIAEGAIELAAQEIDSTLSKAPVHAEGRRLQLRLNALKAKRSGEDEGA